MNLLQTTKSFLNFYESQKKKKKLCYDQFLLDKKGTVQYCSTENVRVSKFSVV